MCVSHIVLEEVSVRAQPLFSLFSRHSWSPRVSCSARPGGGYASRRRARNAVRSSRAARVRGSLPSATTFATMLDSVPWEARAFVASLFVYHVSEYAIARAYNKETLSKHSWLLSKPYCTAMSFAVLEYVLELFLFPATKASDALHFVRLLGLFCVVFGDGLRKAAEITAAASFTHVIQTSRRPQHRVIKHGVYRYVRHPGYLGWFIWSVGTQIMLCNPLGAVVFVVASWRFFKNRIPFEEKALVAMFPGEYAAYAAATRTWIPGIA